MTKLSLDHVANLQNENTAINTINDNSDAIEIALENTLSRDGTQPNSMNANFDMNSNRILNLPSPVSPTEPIRFGDVNVNEVVITKSRSFSSFAQAAASTIPISVDVVQTLGYTIPGDNGAANYIRTSNTDPAAWKFQSVDGQWWTLQVSDATVRPEMFGQANAVALSTPAASVPNSTNGIQFAISFLAQTGGGTIQLSGGMYGVSSVSITSDSIHVKGAGITTTVVLHKPTIASSCFIFSASSSILRNCSISDLSIYSQDITLNKIAINVGDVSVFNCKNIFVGCYPFDGSNGNMYRGTSGTGTALYLGGRELGHVENFSAYANIPLEIGPNINFPAISLDSWTFRNCFFYTSYATNACILFDNGVNISNITFDGAQNWIGGQDGLRWIDGTSVAESYGLAISGVKEEQVVDTTGYFINIQHNTGLKGFVLSDSTAGGRRGIKIRKVFNAKLSNYNHNQSNTEALNLDATAQTFQVEDCFWWGPSTTTISGLNRIYSQPIPTTVNGSSTIPSNALWSTATGTINVGSVAADTDVAANTYNNVRLTHPASTSTITIASGKTLTANNTLTLSGTDSTTQTFPTTNATIARTDAAQTFTGVQTFSSTIAGSINGNAATATTASTVTTNANMTGAVTSVGNATSLGSFTSANLKAALTDETGSGAAVFATSPALVTPTGIVKGDVGLGNVDNTSDATKNTAVATLTNKTLTSPVVNTPTGIVKGDVGLGNVDNTSDTTKWAATKTLTNTTLDPVGTGNNLPLRSYLSGLALSAAGATATFGVAIGLATDSTNVNLMSLASAYTKTTSAWAVGTGNGAMDTGSVANSTWYHVHLIKRLDTGVVDVLFSLSPTSPTLPTNYTIFRRIGSMKTDGSAQWVKFSQNGDEVLWDAVVLDLTSTNPGTAAASRTLTVPTGIKVNALVAVQSDTTGIGDGRVSVSSLDKTDEVAPNAGLHQGGGTATFIIPLLMNVRTNTSAQIRTRNQASGASSVLYLTTHGWIDRRGRDN